MNSPVSPPKPGTFGAFLQSQPQHLHDFYNAIMAELPSNYRFRTDGIGIRQAYGPSRPVLCSHFRVKAEVFAPGSKDWSRVIELLDPKGDLVECTIPAGTLTGRPREAIAALSNRGLLVPQTHNTPIILELIRTWPVSAKQHLTAVERSGWTPDRDAFTLTNGRVITRTTAPSYRFVGEPRGQETGTLADWRAHLAALADGNVNMLFGISAGFSTALLQFTELDTTIYHLHAKTSTGKTRVLRAAMTVWPKIGDREKTWAGTINGLEAEIAASHSILLGLDELRGNATPELPALIYRFANGSTKARGRKEGGAEERASWRTAVLSTGEQSFVDVTRKLGGVPTGGQGVRMLDIPATGESGVFDTLHGSETSADFVARLDRAIRKASGPAGAAFVEKLLEMDDEALEDMLAAEMQRQVTELQQHLALVPGDNMTTEVHRVLQSFALVATAGEWATAWGLTGWTPGSATAAVQTIAARWLAGRGRMPFEQSENLKAMRDYLTTHEQDFVVLDRTCKPVEHASGGPGFRDEAFFYLFPGTLAKLAQERDITLKKLLEALAEGGFLEPGGEGKSWQFRLPSAVPGRPRVYRLQQTILAFEQDQEISAGQIEAKEHTDD